MFRFSVSCKDVGFMIYKLKSFIYKQFAVFFFLWGNGRPNWEKDFELSHLEKEAEWTTVKYESLKNSPALSKRSFADVVCSPQSNNKSVFLRLNYPSDYQKNFMPPKVIPGSGVKSISVLKDQKSARTVLRWVPNSRNVNTDACLGAPLTLKLQIQI